MALHKLVGLGNVPVAQFLGQVKAPNPDSWESVENAWGDADAVLSEDKPVFFLGAEFYQEGVGTLYNGLPIKANLVRTGLVITGKGRKGEWTVDTTVTKEVTGIWPVIRGKPGQIVRIKLGAAQEAADPIRWDGERDFRIGLDSYLDYVISGKFLAVSFESEGNDPWELLSYELEINPVGM